MQRRIGVFGVNEEVLRLGQLLATNPDIAIVRYWSANRQAALDTAYGIGPEVAAEISPLLSDDLGVFLGTDGLDAVIDAGEHASFARVFPDATGRGVQIVSPLTARLLWAYFVAGQDRKAELLQALAEVVESVDLAIDSDELFARMLDIAVGATGADGGSLMLVDNEERELRIRVANGVEPELWPKIRVPLGQGIAGRAAAEARPIHVRGRADADTFHLTRERFDIESAICVPLVDDARVLGVLNLHHSREADAFSESDMTFVTQLARLDAQIIARAQRHEDLESQAERFSAVQEVQALLADPRPLSQRLGELCSRIAQRVGDGVASVYLTRDDENVLRLAAHSLDETGLSGEARVVPGRGVAGRVAASGEPAFLRSADGTFAYLCLPLHAEGQLVGILSVQAGNDAPKDQAAEAVLLEMASAMAEGIARANRDDRISTQATRTGAVNEAGLRMLALGEVAQIARLASTRAATIFEAEHAVVRLLDYATRRYPIRAYWGPAEGDERDQLFGLDKQTAITAIRSRAPSLRRGLMDPQTADSGEVPRSWMIAPLKHDGRVVGSLAVYDKVDGERFSTSDFNEHDFNVFGRFVSNLERALESAELRHQASRQLNLDDETGLPDQSYLARRIEQEIARSEGRPNSFALLTCRVETPDAQLAARATSRVAGALRDNLRDFDVIGRLSLDHFAALLPEPGPAPDQRVAEIARSVTDAVLKSEGPGWDDSVSLAFGYAIHPSDGEDAAGLIARARSARIHMS